MRRIKGESWGKSENFYEKRKGRAKKMYDQSLCDPVLKVEGSFNDLSLCKTEFYVQN